MTEGELYIGDKLISEAYIGEGEIEQIYLKETPYLSTDNFIQYTLAGLTRIIVKPVGQGVITDLQKNGVWYQTIKRTNPQTCYRTVYDTVTPPDKSEQIKAEYPSTPTGLTANGTSIYGFLILGAFNNIPTNSSLKQVIVNIQSATSAGAAYQIFRYADSAVLASGSSDGSHVPPWYNSHDIGTDGRNYSLGIRCTTAGYMNLYGISYTAKYNSYQQPRQEQYDCSTYYTNANFRSVNVPIDSNTAELVIENNNQTIGVCRLYSSDNVNLGNLITNQNVKFATINNKAGALYNFELTCTNPGVNWFTGLFLKEIYNNQSLVDIQYEFEVITNNSLTSTNVTNAVTSDNSNRNIYSRKIIVSNIDFEHKSLKKRVRFDRRNLMFVIKDQNVLLNHYFVNDTVYIEIPDKYLKSGEMIINCLVMPLDFMYNGRSEVYNLNTLALSSVDFEYY